MSLTSSRDTWFLPKLRPGPGNTEALFILRAIADAGEQGSRRALEARRESDLWPGFRAGVEDLLSSELPPLLHLVTDKCGLLVDPSRREDYIFMIGQISQAGLGWPQGDPPNEIALLRERAAYWHSARELLSSHVPVATALKALGLWDAEKWLAVQAPPPVVVEARHRVEARHDRVEAPAVPTAAPPPREPPTLLPDVALTRPEPPPAPVIAPEALVRPLNSNGLRGSVFGTWLTLVFLSWTSIAWTAAVTMPIGVGFALWGLGFYSAIMVPTWGTLWGFLGMSSAQSRTLREIGFQPVGSDHHLARSAARFANDLGIPMPLIGTMPIANAFAMGRNLDDAAIAIGQPLIDRLHDDEVEAIIAHEFGHVVSGDMRRMMLMRTFQNATVWFAVFQGAKQWARFILCFLAETYINYFSRKREYWADAIGATLTSKQSMIGALRAIEASPPPSTFESNNYRFMFHTLFKSHPSTRDRIAAVEQETYIARLPRL